MSFKCLTIPSRELLSRLKHTNCHWCLLLSFFTKRESKITARPNHQHDQCTENTKNTTKTLFTRLTILDQGAGARNLTAL